MTHVADDRPEAGTGRRPEIKVAFIAATLFFTLSPLLTLLAHPPAPTAFVLLLAGWAIFAAVLVSLFRSSPFARPGGGPWLAVAAVAIATIALNRSSEYSAPVGLFGLMTTMPLVRGVILRRMSSRSGIQPLASSHR